MSVIILDSDSKHYIHIRPTPSLRYRIIVQYVQQCRTLLDREMPLTFTQQHTTRHLSIAIST